MRNLKRALSLVLASVMVLGLMIVGTSAASKDFADGSEIEYTEAVDVMTAIDVLEGDETGNFNPKDTLNREQAAKIIASMLLGPANADKLGKNDTIFTDVAKGSWAAGYISYCSGIGILAGDGTGKFLPQVELTGVAFGKMLLCALGYDVDIEGYTGTGWSVNVASDMVDAGIDVDGVTFSDPLTREQAAQMAFNTLKADMVDYDQRGVQIGDVTIGASKAEPATTTQKFGGNIDRDGLAVDVNPSLEKPFTVQFGEKYFPDLTKEGLGDDGDAFGRPGHIWKNDGQDIVDASDDADYVIEGKFSPKDVYDLVGKTAAGYDTTVYVDGDDATVPSFSIVKDNKTDVDFAGNGSVTELFVDNTAKTLTLCVVNTYAGKVSAVYTADDVDDDENPYVTVDDLDFETTAFEEDDVVIYTKGVNDDGDPEIQTMALAEKVEGEVSRVTTKKNFTVDGTKYEYSHKFEESAGDAHNYVTKAEDDVVFYLDAAGYVIYMGDAASSNDYAYVISVGESGNMYGDDKTYGAKLLLADGTIVSVELGNKDKDADVQAEPSTKTVKFHFEHDIVTYTVDDDDVYTLTSKQGLATNVKSLNIKKGSAAIGEIDNTTYTADSKTIYLVANDKDDDDYSVYTGYRAVPDIARSSGTKVAVYAKTGSVATVIYIEAASVENEDDSDVIFIIGKDIADDNGLVKDSDGNYYEFDAVVDGKATTVKVAEATAEAASSNGLDGLGTKDKVVVVKSLTYNSKGFVTKANDTLGTDYKKFGPVESTGKVENEIVYFGGKGYSYTDDVMVAKYDADAKGDKVTISSIERVSTDSNDKVVFVNYKDVVKAALIIVKAGNPSKVALSDTAQQSVSGATDAKFTPSITTEKPLVGDEVSIDVSFSGTGTANHYYRFTVTGLTGVSISGSPTNIAVDSGHGWDEATGTVIFKVSDTALGGKFTIKGTAAAANVTVTAEKVTITEATKAKVEFTLTSYDRKSIESGDTLTLTLNGKTYTWTQSSESSVADAINAFKSQLTEDGWTAQNYTSDTWTIEATEAGATEYEQEGFATLKGTISNSSSSTSVDATGTLTNGTDEKIEVAGA